MHFRSEISSGYGNSGKFAKLGLAEFKTVSPSLLAMSHATKVAQKFASILEGEKDWEKRVVAMQKMEESLKTDFALELTQKDILLFRPGLCNQITDVRTAVAKQACEFTTTLVRLALPEGTIEDPSQNCDRSRLCPSRIEIPLVTHESDTNLACAPCYAP